MVKKIDWESIQWVYIETRIKQALIGYVDDDDSQYVYLHHCKIRDRKGKWVDYFDWLEKEKKPSPWVVHPGCLPVAKSQIKVSKTIDPDYISEDDTGFV